MENHRLSQARGYVFVFAVLLVVQTATCFCSSDDCPAPKLSQKDHRLLEKYKVLQTREGLIFDPAVVTGCDARKRISLLIQHSMGSGLTEADKNFAETHRELVNRVVLTIWPLIADSPAVPSDGALRHEKWMILFEPIIYDQTVVKLVSKNIPEKGLWGDAASLLFSRPLPTLSRLIESRVTNERSTVTEKLYGIAVLSRLGTVQSPTIVQRVVGRAKLTDAQRQTAARLIRKFDSKVPADWSDVQELVEDE
jgi:hypothetical protein